MTPIISNIFELHFSENKPGDPENARLNFAANCFQNFQPFIAQIYSLNTDNDGSFRSREFSCPEKDLYKQAERYIDACSTFNQAIGKQLSLKRSVANKLSYIKEVISKILATQISVVLFEGDSSYESEKIFLNINEKGMRLDNEDIFKAYYFQSITDDNGAEILKIWTQLKESFFDFKYVFRAFIKSWAIYKIIRIIPQGMIAAHPAIMTQSTRTPAAIVAGKDFIKVLLSKRGRFICSCNITNLSHYFVELVSSIPTFLTINLNAFCPIRQS